MKSALLSVGYRARGILALRIATSSHRHCRSRRLTAFAVTTVVGRAICGQPHIPWRHLAKPTPLISPSVIQHPGSRLDPRCPLADFSRRGSAYLLRKERGGRTRMLATSALCRIAYARKLPGRLLPFVTPAVSRIKPKRMDLDPSARSAPTDPVRQTRNARLHQGPLLHPLRRARFGCPSCQ